MTLLGAMFIVFLTLKLVGTITWSWWWVTAPLWGLPAVIVVVLLVVGIVGKIADLAFGYRMGSRWQKRAVERARNKLLRRP